MIRTLSISLALVAFLAGAAAADWVVPSERVRSRVVVRERAERGTSEIGSLRPGDRARWLATAGQWHQVELPDGRNGYVSAVWTTVEAAESLAAAPPVSEPDIPPKRPGFWKRLWRSWFGTQAKVDFVIQEPEPSQKVYRHFDPTLAVSGYATASGSHLFDVILVIDTSTSTNEHAGADVNGDSVAEAEWKGKDSVFQAQIEAARKLISTLRRLPGNHHGERIKLGVVTFAGDESFHLRPEDEKFEHTSGAIYVLADRDAELRVALTGDYDATLATLEELAKTEPVGMTNFAAAIGRATIELEKLEEWGAQSEPQKGAQKIVLFLSDGEPRLPYERLMAERAGIEAAKLASESGIRVNTFALGRNPVTRQVNHSIVKMAERTNGRFVALEKPGEIVSALDATAFTFVDRVQLINKTTDRETDYIATGIDGSFYGEVELQEGMNEIEVVALLFDDTEASETFFIEYQDGRPTLELLEQLEVVRQENESLIDQIKSDLAREIVTEKRVRSRKLGEQDKDVEVSIDRADQDRLIEMQVQESDDTTLQEKVVEMELEDDAEK